MSDFKKFQDQCLGCKNKQHKSDSLLYDFEPDSYSWKRVYNLMREMEKMEEQLGTENVWCECDFCQHWKMFDKPMEQNE